MSRFSITPTENGFYAYFRDLNRRVYIELSEFGFNIVSDKHPSLLRYPIEFFNYQTLYRQVSNDLTSDWKPNNMGKLANIPIQWVREKVFRKIMAQEVRKKIGRGIYSEWRRLINKLPEEKLLVFKNIFNTFGPRERSGTEWSKRSSFWDNKYLVKDAGKYRACVLSLTSLHSHLAFDDRRFMPRDWKEVLSPQGTYTSLNKTLMNLPGGIPLYLMERLRENILTRPIYSRLELLFYLMSFNGNHNRIFQKSTEKEIKKVHTWYKREVNPISNLRKVTLVEDFYRWMADYAENYNGDLMGLAKRSKRWHDRLMFQENYSAINSNYSVNTKLQKLKQTPNIEGITFLETIGDLQEESKKMHHCVASYASKCVNGRSFIFHVEYMGKQATIELSPDGFVVQGHGPYNHSNEAVKYGKRKLGEWGKCLQSSNSVRKSKKSLDWIEPLPF